MLNERKREGEYWTLYKELMDDEEKFSKIFVYLNINLMSCWKKSKRR
jgi:hypothetical protein